jgi:hypothetical protein
MMATALSITYLGAALCYLASPKSVSNVGAWMREAGSPGLLRSVGIALLIAGLMLSAARGPVEEGLLVGLSMGMFAFSMLVIAAPLVDRFVPVTGALAVAVAVIAPWL